MIARSLGVGLFLALTTLGVQAQQTLADLVAEAKVDWMFGQIKKLTDEITEAKKMFPIFCSFNIIIPITTISAKLR